MKGYDWKTSERLTAIIAQNGGSKHRII